jgi:prepilin-type N-terminal cleavage/methylation domain-containing protein
MLKSFFRKGFTLVELSVSLVVLGIVIYSALAIYTKRAEISRIADTQAKMKVIEASLRSYYLKSGTLPCPADGALVLGDGSFGIENCSATTGTAETLTERIGVLPTRTLNLQDTYMFDAWGGRFTYAVNKTFSEGGSWGTVGTITVSNNLGGTLTAEAVYVVISHGKNGVGAWRRYGANERVGNTGISAHEDENAHVDLDGFPTGWNDQFRDDVINDGDIEANYFDDLVKWKTKEQIDYGSRFE